MFSSDSLRALTCFLAVLLLTLGGCARPPDTGKTLLTPKTLDELQGYFLSHKPDLEQFRASGPFSVSSQENYEIRLSNSEVLRTDLYLSGHADKAPLAIFLHGYDSNKDNHTYQAMHLASWGIHSLSVQLPNTGPWLANGRTLAKFVRFVQRWPEIIDSRVDIAKIILVGHSFGGASVTVALGEGAPVIGAILLDPAVVGIDVARYLKQSAVPMMVLGADERVSMARNRENFYRHAKGGVFEVSVKDAAHEDGQFPAPLGYGNEAQQLTFVSAITAAAISLSALGNYDFAWASFKEPLEKGTLFNAKKK